MPNLPFFVLGVDPSSLSVRPNRSIEKKWSVQVLVRNNTVDQALKVLKKKMQARACSGHRAAHASGTVLSHVRR
jgi:hypothetical protein